MNARRQSETHQPYIKRAVNDRKSEKIFTSELNFKMPEEKGDTAVNKSEPRAEDDVSKTIDSVAPKGSSARSNSDGSVVSRDLQPSRAERLRKSIVAKSTSSLAPLYVTQILPAEQRYYPQVTFERTKGPGYLYILSESAATGFRGDLFKVGVTNDLKMRLRDIQNGNPRPLIPELLLKVYNMEKVEDYISDVLRHHRSDLNGGQGWYKAETRDGHNVVLELVADVKKEYGGVEIPPEKFRDYMNYYINFEC